MNDQPQESDARELRKPIPLPAGIILRGYQKTAYNGLSVHPGQFHAMTIANCAGLNVPAARHALAALVEKCIIQIEQWNDENYDPLYSVVARQLGVGG